MKSVRGGVAAVLATAVLCAASGAAAADAVLLKNGAVFEGEVVARNDEVIVLRLEAEGDEPAVEMEFARDRVDRIIYEEGLLPSRRTVVLEDEPEEEEEPPADRVDRDSLFGQGDDDDDDGGEAGGGGDGESIGKTDEETPPGEDGEEAGPDGAEEAEPVDPQVAEWIRRLASEEDAEQQSARKKLAAWGGDAVRPLIKSLKGAPLEQRRYIIATLGDIGDKRAVSVLIDELNVKQAEINPPQELKMRWTWIALKKITGQSIYFDEEEDDQARRRFYVKEWRKWFESVEDAYPEQIPIVDPEEEEGGDGNGDA